MVGTAQSICLPASGTERRRHDSIMNLRNWSDHSVSLQYEGWTPRPFFRCLTAAGEVFVLTSPFIERDYRIVETVPRKEDRPVVNIFPGQDLAW